MKTMKSIITLLCLFLLMGCTDDDLVKVYKNIQVKATTDHSRTVFSETEGMTQVSWENKDAISLMTGSQTNLKYVASSTGCTSEFVAESTQLQAIEGDSVYAFYPWNSQTNDSIQFKQFRTQYHKDNGNACNLMEAKGVITNEQLQLKFSHLLTYLKVTIPTDRFPGLAQGLFIRSSVPLSSKGRWYPKEKKFSQTYPHLFYKIEEKDLAGKDNIVCYIAMLPVPEGTELVFCEFKNNASGEKLFSRTVPQGGMLAGQVYTMEMETQAEVDERARKQRDALVALYNATGGDSWTNSTNWNTDEPINQWYGVSASNEGITKLDLRNNNLNGNIPEEIANLNTLEYLYLQNNNLTGNLPVSMANLVKLKRIYLYGNQLSGSIPQEILDCDMWNNVWDIECIVWQQEGFKLVYNTYESTDYSKDGEVYVLLKHSKGNGIKVVLTGDGYSDRLIKDGTFDTTMKEAMEGFFDREPLRSLREYFDVYVYTAVSKNEVIGEETALNTKFTGQFGGASGHVASDTQLIIEKLRKALPAFGRSDLKDILTIVTLNSTASYRNNCIMYSDGFSLCNTNKDNLLSTLVHEAAGHGFGLLADEYIESGNEEAVFPDNLKEALRKYQEKGRRLNVDITNDENNILWADFLKDERYTNENLGIYEGGFLYAKGIYRSTENSMMRYHSNEIQFNAPSRWAIYQRAMKLAGEECNFDNFLELDAAARKIFDDLATSRSICPWQDAEPIEKYCAPPTFFDYPSSAVGK